MRLSLAKFRSACAVVATVALGATTLTIPTASADPVQGPLAPAAVDVEWQIPLNPEANHPMVFKGTGMSWMDVTAAAAAYERQECS